MVDAFERKGYVNRTRDPDDGRALRLEPTPAGVGLHRRIEDDILAQERLLLSAFPPEVRRSMAVLVGELARAAADRIDTSDGAYCTVK